MTSGYEDPASGVVPSPRRPGVAGAAVVMIVLAFFAAAATTVLTASITVTDGDTIRVDGERVRLVGFNAPETANAQCERERELGDRATARLRELVVGVGVTFEKVACACRPGTEGTNACNYGRACGTLRVARRDVGEILMAEGLAVPFVCGTTRCPATPRPWCE